MMMMPSIFGGNLFNDDWMDFSFPDIDKELYGKHAKNLMKTDVKEKDGNYEVAIDLPGFKKDEITAELKDGYLTISAAKGLDKDEKDKEGKYIRRERYAGNMSRSFYVGKDITEKDIHGKYENGILMLDIPKKAPEKKVEEKKFVTIEDKRTFPGMIRFPGNLSIYLRMKGKEGETKWQQNVIYMKFLESVKLQMKKRSRKHIGNWQRNIIQI